MFVALLCIVCVFHHLQHFELNAAVGLGRLDQRLHIFRKARAAVARTGVQKVVANARISANAFAQGFDVGAQLFCQIGQFVHEADARGQHAAVFQNLDLGCVHIQAQHVVAHRCFYILDLTQIQ
jgi:hypothetical protein